MTSFFVYIKYSQPIYLQTLGRGGALSSPIIIEHVAYNKSSLLLTIQKYNTQTLQLFTNIIKWEST